MIHFPDTLITESIEKVVVEGLQRFTPKNEEKGIQKVVELIKSAREIIIKNGDLGELSETHRKISCIRNPEDSDWLGFTYYYLYNGKILVGLFQMNKKWWKKEEPK